MPVIQEINFLVKYILIQGEISCSDSKDLMNDVEIDYRSNEVTPSRILNTIR